MAGKHLKRPLFARPEGFKPPTDRVEGNLGSYLILTVLVFDHVLYNFVLPEVLTERTLQDHVPFVSFTVAVPVAIIVVPYFFSFPLVHNG